MLEGLVPDGHAARRPQAAGQAAFLVREGPPDNRRDLVVGQRLEAIDPQAREQGRVHLEVWVLRRGADERDGAFFDMRQQSILLSLVEAVDLVDEEDGLAAVEAEPVTGLHDEGAHLCHAAHDGGDRDQRAPTASARTRARLVLPLPGGPQRRIKPRRPRSVARRTVRARRSGGRGRRPRPGSGAASWRPAAGGRGEGRRSAAAR